MKRFYLVVSLLCATICLVGCCSEQQNKTGGFVFSDTLSYNPKSYVCYKTISNIVVDGDISSPEWESAPWSDVFVDIEGDKQQKPLQSTRVKMLWNDTYLYVAAELKETDVWANLTERESVVFYDNDFEVFI
ncbi:MAG: carbohydrate-binding family 9-like protein, partial [Rikenellaceae bacterium]